MFEQVVFAGGGNRCWWQAGFWDVVRPGIGLRPKLIAGVSAGAATACLLYANDSLRALDYYERVLAENTRNFYPRNLFKADVPAFPHNAIYRQALRCLLGGEHFRRLQTTAPELRIRFSRLPSWLGPRRGVVVGLLAYNIEKYARRSLHPTFGRKLGFTSEVGLLQECGTEDELISLIIASSCTPPFTPIEYRDGAPTLDGGLVDNVPVDAVDVDGGPVLVLTTRRYPGRAPVFMVDGRIYVQPSEKTPASSWDYTNVAALRATYALGRRDGEAFLGSWAVRDDHLAQSLTTSAKRTTQ